MKPLPALKIVAVLFFLSGSADATDCVPEVKNHIFNMVEGQKREIGAICNELNQDRAETLILVSKALLLKFYVELAYLFEGCKNVDLPIELASFLDNQSNSLFQYIDRCVPLDRNSDVDRLASELINYTNDMFNALATFLGSQPSCPKPI